MQSTDPGRELDALLARDPETLVGPLLWLLTRLARDCASADMRRDCTKVLVDQLTALAAHPGVAYDLRLAAGALAIEHRDLRLRSERGEANPHR